LVSTALAETPMHPPELAPLLSSAVGLVTALVLGLSVYLNYKGRHNPFRQAVYNKQMEAYFDIAEAMAALYTAADNILAVANPRLRGEDARQQFRTALREEHERFTGTVNRSLIVMPSKVKAAADHFNAVFLSIVEPAEEGAADAAADPGAELAGAFERAINCIRHHLAIDSLTTGMLNEMGIGSESVALKRVRPGVNPLVTVGRAVR
jgi:hypothetical protein